MHSAHEDPFFNQPSDEDDDDKFMDACESHPDKENVPPTLPPRKASIMPWSVHTEKRTIS